MTPPILSRLWPVPGGRRPARANGGAKARPVTRRLDCHHRGGAVLPAIAFLGIIAAIAIPAYQDYTLRARRARPSAAAPLKIAYAEYILQNGELPADIGAPGHVPEIKTTTAADRPQRRPAGAAVQRHAAERRAGTEPWLDDNGQVAWLCGYAGLPDWQDAETATALTEASASDYTSVKSRSTCRSHAASRHRRSVTGQPSRVLEALRGLFHRLAAAQRGQQPAADAGVTALHAATEADAEARSSCRRSTCCRCCGRTSCGR